ncbi:MAG TPA: hypothetical protein VGN31_06815, partial [Paraburkholderia sp.]
IVAPLTLREKQFIQKWCNALSIQALSRMMQTPVEVIDAFVRAGKLSGVRRDARLPEPRLYTRAKTEWLAAADADVAERKRPLRVAWTGAAQAFIDQWSGRLSYRNLGTLMNLADTVIAEHLRLSAPAMLLERGSGPSPQPGPSGHQGPLSADQQARISELHAERLSPSTIAMYVGKPREMVEAYLQRERDRTYRRS